MQQQAFGAGREEEEIRALWKAAHQKVLLDEAWLHDLLAPLSPVPLSPLAGAPRAPPAAEPSPPPRARLVGAPHVSPLPGPGGGGGGTSPGDRPRPLRPGA